MPIAVSAVVEPLAGQPADAVADVIVVPMFEGDDLSQVGGIDLATSGEAERLRSARELTGRAYEVALLPLSDWRAHRLMLIGAGTRDGWSTERLRRLASAAGLALKQRRIGRAAFVVRGVDPTAGAQAATEGLTLAEFSNALYKTAEPEGASPRELVIVVPGGEPSLVRAACERGRVLGESCNLARELCNEPGNMLTPRVFAERASHVAAEAGLHVEVLDEQAIAGLKMGLLLGVSRGSAEPPRVIVLRHEPPGAPATPVLGLVGKGVTFDTGGISIKSADGMDRMKDDMSGGAAVIMAMRAMSILKAPMRVVGVIPAAENMPGSRAIKPGDVLTSASGKTVEVTNTDAEGRLILGDGLWLALRLGATHLLDVATLTGACVVALGKMTSGLFGTPEPWVSHVREVAMRAGDRCWHMPLPEDYFDQLRSEVADMLNSGGRPGGSITAALFLKEFSGGLPWAHLDIAGTAWSDESKPYQPKGATGVAVRTLAELAFTELPN